MERYQDRLIAHPTKLIIYYFVANLKDFGSLKDGQSHLELIKMDKCQQVITLLTGRTKTEGNMVQ